MRKYSKNSKINTSDIDIAVCYHKPSMIFSSDALQPMQLDKELSDIDLPMRGDNTGDNISTRNRFYSEDTALYWLWKNSKANIKGCLHYRRLLDLTKSGENNYSVIMEDIKKPAEFIKKLGLTRQHIQTLMKDADILIRNKTDINEFFDGSIEEQFKAAHIPYHWDLAMDIVKNDFPEIYDVALEVAKGQTNYFHNAVIMKSELFDKMCQFCFHITEKLSTLIDETRLEFNDNWRYTARYLSFVFERMTGVYITYLVKQGHTIKEFPAVSIAPRENPELENVKNYDSNAYNLAKKDYKIIPAFNKKAVAIMMSTDDNYVPCCITMLQSIKEHADPRRQYDIVITTRNISNSNKAMLQKISTENISVRIHDISEYVKKFDTTKFNVNAHFTLDAYSRLFIPDLFEKYDKLLYLDVDMVAMKDVAELYDTDIGENWWGVVQDKFFVTICHSHTKNPMKKDLVDYIHNTLKMDCIADMFNSGVMIWNIKKCIKDKVLSKCLNKLSEITNPKFVDQCILNSVANGKNIYWLSPYWNVFWNVSMHWLDGYNSESYNTALHYTENPYILHFTGCIKPWNEPWRDNAELFWQYARKTPVYEKLISKIIFKVNLYMKNNEINAHLNPHSFYKKKIRKYKTLNAITLGAVRHFREKKHFYRVELAKL